jgi:adenylyltransferase/sulfurtransferase
VLTDDQLERYARHIVLREIGGEGQKALMNARVAVIGAGGLGSPCLQYLAAAGVGTIALFDDDRVSLSNLQRQVLHGTPDIGALKVISATAVIERINPDVRVLPVPARITPENAAESLEGYDVIADGSDSFATRRAVAGAAHALRIPLVSAAIGPFEGQLSVFRGWEPGQPCYRCLVGDARDREGETCAEQGVLGALAGVMGAMQALEVVRQIVPFGEGLAGRLLLFDALSMRMRTIALPKDPACPQCA